MDSTELFARRKEAKELPPGPRITALLDLKMQGLKLVAHDDDTWNQRALAWILIDLCKLLVGKGNHPQAQINYAELIKLVTNDEIIEGQQEYLEKIVDPFHKTVKTLNQKSKDGHHDEAVNGFSSMLAANQLSPVHHETYGWAIYRLLKAKAGGYTSVQVRRWLKHYLDLKNERPSMLHSQILNWTMKYAETDPELRTMDFLKIWDATKFQAEDFEETTAGDITFSPLYSRLCSRLIADPRGVDLPYLLNNVNTHPGWGDESNEVRIVDGLRKAYFWKLLDLEKDGKKGLLWQSFTTYAEEYGQYPPSEWHTEILQLANRLMKETEEYRFLPFFKAWNPENLRKEDWKEKKKKTKEGEKMVIPPTAKSAVKKACVQALKKKVSAGSLDWLVAACKEAKKHIPSDEYLPRDYAKILWHNGQTKEATEAYRKLTLTLGDKYYVWGEFADLMTPEQIGIKAGMLAKALALEKNEDYLGTIRLNMAMCLLDLNDPAGSAYELEAYHKQRVAKGWKVEDNYHQLRARIPAGTTAIKADYTIHLPLAHEYAYESIKWVNMTVIARFETPDGKKRVKLYMPPGELTEKEKTMAFLMGVPPETVFSVNEGSFKALKKVRNGDTLRVKFYKNKTKYRPLLIEKSNEPAWVEIPFVYAVVDYINKDKQVVHAVSHTDVQAFFSLKEADGPLKKGDFVTGHLLVETKKDGSKRISIKTPKLVDTSQAESHFKERLVLVDSVNAHKKLFHFITENSVDGIIYFSDTDLRPAPGDHFMAKGYVKLNKKTGKKRLQPFNLEPTDRVMSSKIKELDGLIDITYGINKTFGFVADTYVPGHLIASAGIEDGTHINATAIYSGGKWRVVAIGNSLG